VQCGDNLAHPLPLGMPPPTGLETELAPCLCFIPGTLAWGGITTGVGRAERAYHATDVRVVIPDRGSVCRRVQQGLLSPQYLLQRLDQVLQHMEAVSHLDRVRCPARRAFGEVCTTVATDDRD
jgi:hypothetical protein